MAAVVIQIVVVAGIKRRAGARRPTKQGLRTQTRVQRIVIEDESREAGLRKLICRAQGQNIDRVCNPIRVVAPQSLAVDIELRTQRLRGLISDAGVELKQTSAAGIERRILSQRKRCRTDPRILVTVAEVKIEMPPPVSHLRVELNLLVGVGTHVERQVLLV